MKKVWVLAALCSLALMFGLATQGLAQANPQSEGSNQAQQQQPSQDGAGNEQAKTFVGKIVEADGKLVLQDMANKTTYQLDDQEKAKGFVDQKVRVTGTLDASSGMIRVSAIERAA
jgi:uncharacterized protein YdeI (BOF family)